MNNMLFFDFVNVLTTLSCGMLGLTLFPAPDLFWNPDNGWMLPVSFATKTNYDSNHFSTGTRACLMGAGAFPVGFLIYHCFFLQKDQVEEKRAFMRVKLTAALAKFVLFAHAAFLQESDMLNKSFFVFFTAFLFCNAGMMALALIWTPPPSRMERQLITVLSKQEKTGVILSLVYTIPFVILLSFFPRTVSPVGSMPFILKTSRDDNSFDDLEVFVTRFEGASLATCLGSLWNFSSFPKQLKRRADATLVLFTFVFLRGVMDTTGTCNRKAYAVQLIAHLIICFTTIKLTTKADKKIIATKRQTAEPVLVPDLKVEESHTKKE